MRSLRRALAGAGLLAVGVLGCSPTVTRATMAQLQQRAMLDAACPPQALAAYPLDARTRVVTGCGLRLVYVESCESLGSEVTCSWLLDSARSAAPGVLPWVTGPAAPVRVPAGPPVGTPAGAPGEFRPTTP
jgi:hypothetical protein